MAEEASWGTRPAVHPVGLDDIEHEWDLTAEPRAEQIESRKDLSFHHILLPTIDELRAGRSHRSVLDAGCGGGFLTAHLADSADSVTGVDLSGANIDIACRRHKRRNIRYVRSSIEGFATNTEPGTFSLVIANMVLTTAPQLGRFVTAVATLMAPAGSFIFTVAHPWFWPAYWEYNEEPWFRYDDEIAIQAPFRISLDHTELDTTHFHRPLEMYLQALRAVGLSVVEMREPMPSQRVEALYPAKWRFPRFLAVRALKTEHV